MGTAVVTAAPATGQHSHHPAHLAARHGAMAATDLFDFLGEVVVAALADSLVAV